MGSRTATQAIESDVDPLAVLDVLTDPTRIPEWAPDFADTVTGHDQLGWRATKDGRVFAVRVVAQRDAGTVDYLREVAPGREGGAFLRVVPRPEGGSVVVMTIPLAPGANQVTVTATLRDELNAQLGRVDRS